MRHFIIPARGGSKTVQDKNLRDLGGVPLIGWSIARAQEAAGHEGIVVVDSDDRKILDIAEGLGAKPYLRPSYLGDDHATMKDVVKEYFSRNEEIQEIVLLFPTCPFRTSDSIRRAISLYQLRQASSLMSVSPCNRRPYGGVLIVDGKIQFAETAEAFYRKQDTPALYFANGSIFIINRDEIGRLNTQMFNAETVPFVMDGLEEIDIDTELDLTICQALVTAGAVSAPLFGPLVRQ